MKVIKLSGIKVSDVGSLWHDLLKGGFHVESVGANADATFLYMADDEGKDPRPIVESWVGKPAVGMSLLEAQGRREEILRLLETKRGSQSETICAPSAEKAHGPRPGHHELKVASDGQASFSGAVKALRVKVIIINYRADQLKYLHQVVSEYKGMARYQVDLNIYTTVPLEYPHVLYLESEFPKSLPAPGHQLPWPSRKEMAAEVDNYDLFIYTENDHLITEDNIEAFLEHSGCLQEGQVSGFIQYELDAAGKKILIVNPYWDKLTKERTSDTFQLRNVHQGCWILLRKDLKRAIDSRGFLVGLHAGPYGGLEQAASDPYTQCGLTKVFPTYYGLCERLLIHHLPNKYIHNWQWKQRGVDLRDLFENHLPVESS